MTLEIASIMDCEEYIQVTCDGKDAYTITTSFPPEEDASFHVNKLVEVSPTSLKTFVEMRLELRTKYGH